MRAYRRMARVFLLGIPLLLAVCTVGGDGGTGPDDDDVLGEPKTTVVTTFDDVFVYSIDPDENYNDGSPSCPNCGNALKLSPQGGGQGGEARILLKYWFYEPANLPRRCANLS